MADYKEFEADPNSSKTPFQQYKEAANTWKKSNPKGTLSQFYKQFGQVDKIPLKNRARAGQAETNPDFQRKGAGTFNAEKNRSNQVKINTFKLEELTTEAKKLFKEQKIKEIDYNGKKLNPEQFAKVKLREFRSANNQAKLSIRQQPGMTLGHIIDPKGQGSIESAQNWFAEKGKGKGGNFSNQNIQRSNHALKILGLKVPRSVHLRNILTNNTPTFTDAQKLNTLEGKGARLGGVKSTTKVPKGLKIGKGVALPRWRGRGKGLNYKKDYYPDPRGVTIGNGNGKVKIKGGFGQNPRTKGRFGDFGEGNIPGYRPVQKIQIPGTLLTLPMA